MILTDFGDLIAERMRAEHHALAGRWFERLLSLLPVDARDVFPTESLLDHVPSLILEISAYLQDPEDAAIAANTSILAKARELGALRHSQRASLHQVLREYQVLSGVLVTFVLEEIERLEQFTRMAAHEWRQPLGALQFGVSLLRRPDLDSQRAERTLAAVERNVQRLVELTHKLEVIARMQSGGDNAIVQEVSATTIAQEAARQLREMADARGVDIRIAEDLPTLTVDIGRLELVLVNLLSN